MKSIADISKALVGKLEVLLVCDVMPIGFNKEKCKTTLRHATSYALEGGSCMQLRIIDMRMLRSVT